MKISIVRLALVGGAALAVAGCASYGGHGYGYTGLSYGYASPYYGWYDNYYYPGTGYYVYERSGTRHRWSDHQRRYWQARRGDRNRHDNWSGYHRDHDRNGGHSWSRGRSSSHSGHSSHDRGHGSGHDRHDRSRHH
jgi:hypothetical protein